MLQLVSKKFHRLSKPDCVRRVILDFVVRERMNEDIEPLTIEHQPRHNICREGILRKDRLHLWNRMRPSDTNELGPAGLRLEPLDQDVMQLGRPCLRCIVEVDVDMKTMKIGWYGH